MPLTTGLVENGTRTIPNTYRRRKVLAAAVLGVLAIVEVLAVTRAPGPGLDPDSASYLGAAESLVHGHGLEIPMADWYQPRPAAPLAHFPPGFSFAIAGAMQLGLSPPQAARAVNAVAAAVTVATMTVLVAVTGGIPAGIVTGVALLVGRPFVLARISVLSEPLFLCLLALTLWGLMARWPPLATGLLGALAALTRYAGVGVVAGVGLWQLLEALPVRERIKRAALSAIPPVLLLGAWVVRAHQGHGPTAIRRFGFYGGFGRTLEQGASTLGGWLVPTTDDQPGALWAWLAAVAVAAAVVLVIRGTRRARVDRVPAVRALAICGTMLGSYVAVLVASRLLADPGIPFDERILAPFILIATGAIVLAAASAWPRWGLLLRGGAAVVFLAWLAASALASLDDATWATTNGSDFAGEDWRTSAVLAWARQHEAAAPLYSNWPEAVFFHLHRPAWLLPLPGSGPRQWQAFADTLARRGAVVIAFNAPSPDVAPPDSIAAAAHLRVLARLSDGTVYGPAAR